MAGVPRESSFMPTIKCSTCGNQVEISMMGEHICGGPPKAAGGGGGGGGRGGGGGGLGGLLADTFMPLGKSIHDKIGAIPPVDTVMANRSYSRQPLTPLSLSSGSRSVSPRTPGGRPSIGRADDYFTPTIANDDQPPMPPTSRSGGYGGFSDMDSEPSYPSTSPKNGSGLLNRIGSIAAGPYAQDYDDAPPVPKLNAALSQRMNRDGPRPGTSASSNSVSPPRMPRNNGYGGFGPPPSRRDEPSNSFASPPNRSQTFPERQISPQEPAPLRAPSAPGPRPDRLRDTSRPPPPRRSLVKGTKNPSINLEAEFGANNPYHSPSASIASSLSRGSSEPSQPSSQTSPARSATSARKPDLFDSLLNDVQASMDELHPKELSKTSNVRSPPSVDRYDPAIQSGRPPSPPPTRWDMSDRRDPAIQGPLRSASKASKKLPPSPFDAPARRRDPAVQNSRGNCRSCSQAITGKSISSADGRLTGRYHKACFVCTSCREPFQTAEFYVHNDKPYCKLHYHTQNGSLCGTCRDGIEGQYLEDESTKKYHVQCFRCGDCQNILRDGYYEVGGKAFCERDAFRRLQAMQSSRRSPSVSSARSYASSNLAPPGRPGMRPPGGGGGMPYRAPGLPMGGPGRMGPPLPSKGPGMGPGPMGLQPPSMPRMEKRRTRLGMM